MLPKPTLNATPNRPQTLAVFCLATASMLVPHATLAQRVSPLQITIPSLPADVPAPAVENDLAVRLLDAQIASTSAETKPVILSKAPLPVSVPAAQSNQVVIGNQAAAPATRAPAKTATPARKVTASKPRIHIAAAAPQAPATLSAQDTLQPSAASYTYATPSTLHSAGSSVLASVANNSAYRALASLIDHQYRFSSVFNNPQSNAPLKLASSVSQLGTLTLAQATPDVTIYAEMKPASGTTSITNASLSRESKHLLSHIPSKIDSPKSSGRPIKIERENNGPIAPLIDESTTLDAAHDSFGMSIEMRRPNFNVHEELTSAYDATVLGHYGYALESYERVLRHHPNNISGLYGKAALLHQMGDINGAKKFYGKVIHRDKDHREALNNFLSIMADEAPDEALTELLKLQRKNPYFSPIPAQISYVYSRMNDYPRAISAMSDATRLAPDNLTYTLNLAALLDRYGAKQKAAPYYQRIIDAHIKGEQVPGNIEQIQKRLTFIRSNRS